MTTNTKYITHVFPLILLVCATSVFAMEKEKQAAKLDEITEKYEEYGKPYLDCVHKPLVIIRTLNNRRSIKTLHGTVSIPINTNYMETQYLLTTGPLGTPNRLSQYYKFSIFMEAVKDLRVNLGCIFSIMNGLKVSPNTAVSESYESTTKSISSIGTSFLGCVVRLIVKKDKKHKIKILEDLLLKFGGDPDRLVFYKSSSVVRIPTNRGCTLYFDDGENKLYGPTKNFYTPQQILNQFKKQQDLSMNQNKIIKDIDSLLAKTRYQLALESINNQQEQ